MDRPSAAGLVATAIATAQRSHPTPPVAVPDGSGTGRSLPPYLLIIASLCSLFATLLSLTSIYSHLKNYRKPHLQRFVVRLILIVPIYSTSSAIGLFSLPAAFLIDLIRDLYEAFAIYCFFELLVAYLGGERSVLVLMIGRRPIQHPWPFRIFLREMDMSDPYTFLAIKRGILQYVQIKPILAASTVILKTFGRYEEGELSAGNGYTYVSTVYNVSIFLSLYCLAIFWQALSQELEPFRPTAKFLTVKGVVFATFWQGWAISVLVAAGLVKHIGPITDPSFLGLGLQDFLLCLEMPLFALGHMYAFSPADYVDSWATHQARLPIIYALRDSLGGRDVLEDSLTTIRGTGYGYQTFEPSQGAVHQGLARSRRLHAGLRYTAGGKGKYFLPTRSGPHTNGPWAAEGTRLQGPLAAMRRWMEDRRMREGGFAPMTEDEEAGVLHENPDDAEHEGDEDEQTRREKAEAAARRMGAGIENGLRFFTASAEGAQSGTGSGGVGGDGGDSVSLGFHTPTSQGSEQNLYAKARSLEHGDYAFPTIACGPEEQRKRQHREEEEWLLGGSTRGSKGKGRGKSTGTKERRKRVEGWLERARGLMGESNESGEEAADRDDDIIEVKGKKRPSALKKDREEDAEERQRRPKIAKKSNKSDSSSSSRKKKEEEEGGDDRKGGGEGQVAISSKTQHAKSGDSSKANHAKSVWGAWGESFSKSKGSKIASDHAQEQSRRPSNPADESHDTNADESLASTQPGDDDHIDEEEDHGAVDLIISDPRAEERKRDTDRRRGDPALRARGYGSGAGDKVFRRIWTGDDNDRGGATGPKGSAAPSDKGAGTNSRSKQVEAPHASRTSSSSSAQLKAAAPPPTHKAGVDAMEGQLSTEIEAPGESSSSSSSKHSSSDGAKTEFEAHPDKDPSPHGKHSSATTISTPASSAANAATASHASHMPVYERHDWAWHAAGQGGGQEEDNPWA